MAMAASEYGIVWCPQPRIAWSLLLEEKPMVCGPTTAHPSLGWMRAWRGVAWAAPLWLPISQRDGWAVVRISRLYQAPINADHTEGWSWNQGIQTCCLQHPTGRVWIRPGWKVWAVKSLSLSYSTLHARHSLMDKPTAVGGFCRGWHWLISADAFPVITIPNIRVLPSHPWKHWG